MSSDDISLANQFKEKGNEQFRNKNWEKALQYFSEAIQLDCSNHIFYSNRSATYFQLKQYSKSLEDADTVVEMQPNWSKGYIRQGSALFALGVYSRAKKSFETGVGLDPSNQELVSGLARSQIALEINRLIPNGLLAQVPIFFDQNKRIDWESVETACEVFVNRDVSALWAVSPASEMNHLNFDECREFTRRIIQKSKHWKIPVISGLRPQSSLQALADEAKVLSSYGASAIVIDILSFGKSTDSDQTLLNNIETFTPLVPNIPIGITDTKERPLTPFLVQGLFNLNKFYFLVTHSSSLRNIESILKIVGHWLPSFKIYSANSSTLVPLLQSGGSGYAGKGATFFPKIYSWMCSSYKSDPKLSKNISSFINLIDPILDMGYPLNAKLFLKLHEDQLCDILAETRADVKMDVATEANFLRLNHLQQAAKMVTQATIKTDKKKDNSVLL